MAQALSRPFGRLLCIGDVHGCAGELDVLLRDIDPQPEDMLVLLGDYVDRGPDAAAVVRTLAALCCELPATVLLRGNHEDMMLAYFGRCGSRGEAFLANGGVETLASFGVSPPAPRSDPPAPAGELAAAIAFLQRAMVLHVAVGGFTFVHAGVRPHLPLAEQSRDDLLWIREEFTFAEHGLPTTVVFGHTPCREVLFEVPGKIGIDTGCVFGGRLTALDLSNGRMHQVQRGQRFAIRRDVRKALGALAA